MTNIYDRASALEEQTREQALAAQAQRAGLAGKTVADSRTNCIECSEDIPMERREAIPGCQRCIDCQSRKERDFYER